MRLDDLKPGVKVTVSSSWEGKDQDDETITDYAGQSGEIIMQSTFDQSLVRFGNGLPDAWFYDTDLSDVPAQWRAACCDHYGRE